MTLTYDQGLAPTILVIRIALTDTSCTTDASAVVTHVSALRFQSQKINDDLPSTWLEGKESSARWDASFTDNQV